MTQRTVTMWSLLFVLLFANAASATERAHIGGELKLLAGMNDGTTFDFGLEIALDPGWKTYWRSPGDGGIPPTLDHEGSTNIASVEIGFPAPTRFTEGASESIGYTSSIVLPLRIKLQESARPGHLVLKVLVGICKDICVPVDAAFEATVEPGTTPTPRALSAIASAKARLPKLVEVGADLSIVSVSSAPDRTKPAMVFTAKSDPGQELDLFVEGPPTWRLRLPERIASINGFPRWQLSLDGVPVGATTKGAPLRFTLTAGRRASEQRWILE